MLNVVACSSSFLLCFILLPALSTAQVLSGTLNNNGTFQGFNTSNTQLQTTSDLKNISTVHRDVSKQTNLTDASVVEDDDVFKNRTWSPENATPARFKNKKVPLFGLAPEESAKKKGVSESLGNKPDNNAITKVIVQPLTAMAGVGQNESTVTDLIAQILLKQQELINKIVVNAADVGASQMSEPSKTSLAVKQNNASNSSEFAATTTLNDLNEESESEEFGESENISVNSTNSKFLSELLNQMAMEPTTSSPTKIKFNELNSTQPPRELLDSLLSLPPSLLDQAAKSVESGQITPEALASLLKLRPDLLGDAAGRIDTKQITPDVIRSLLKLRMTFMESGGTPQAFDQFARGSPDDLVKLMKVMSPAENSTKPRDSKTKSKKNPKSKKVAENEASASNHLNPGSFSLLGDVTSETEVKPTAEPAILPNLLTLIRPHLLNLIGLDSSAVLEQQTKGAGEKPNQQRLRNQHDPDRFKSHRFGLWRQPKKCRTHRAQYPHYPHYFPQHVPNLQHPRFRRPSRPNNSKNPVLKAVSKGLESISNHFQKKAKFVSHMNN